MVSCLSGGAFGPLPATGADLHYHSSRKLDPVKLRGNSGKGVRKSLPTGSEDLLRLPGPGHAGFAADPIEDDGGERGVFTDVDPGVVLAGGVGLAGRRWELGSEDLKGCAGTVELSIQCGKALFVYVDAQ
jgi:hypothetical protein